VFEDDLPCLGGIGLVGIFGLVPPVRVWAKGAEVGGLDERRVAVTGGGCDDGWGSGGTSLIKSIYALSMAVKNSHTRAQN
jgi:hypothetical protein